MDDSFFEALLAANNPAEKAAIVAESVFNSLPEPTALVARRCVILHWFNQQIVEALLPESTSNQAIEVYQQLKSLPFIASFNDRLTYHDLTREGLLERYIVRQPDLLRDGAKRAALVYESHNNNNLTVAAEAFFCHAVAGNLAAAIQWRDKLLAIATDRKDWQFYNNILQMQQEFEKLPFVEPLERFFAYDVFISYSTQDREWVQNELLPDLEKQGLGIWVDRNIELGDSFTAEIEQAVQTSRKILLILSPDYLNNIWTQFEESVLYKLEISNWVSRLIPLRKEKFAFPSPLSNLNYVDFAEPNNLNVAWKQLVAAQRSLELADEYARRKYPDVEDYVVAYWRLGAAHRVNGNIEESDRHLTEAITRCRAINLVRFEADILLELARLRLATEKRDEALRLADEALEITERCGYVLQGADVHLFLAQLALADDDRQKALFHAREARRLATCDGPPNYTYKVAYEEAGVLLEELGEGK